MLTHLLLVVSASLSINIASVSANGVELSPIPSVGLSVCLSRKCTVAKWLIGSGCRLDGEWGRSRMGVLDRDGNSRRGRGLLVVNLGRPIVTNWDFVA